MMRFAIIVTTPVMDMPGENPLGGDKRKPSTTSANTNKLSREIRQLTLNIQAKRKFLGITETSAKSTLSRIRLNAYKGVQYLSL